MRARGQPRCTPERTTSALDGVSAPTEIVAPLGAGGMGEVWRAHDAALRRDVAIKCCRPNPPVTSSRFAFQLEARAAAALNHPNILTIFAVR